MDGSSGLPARAAADPNGRYGYARGDAASVRKPSPFAVHSLRQQFHDPAVEAAFQRWQTEVVFYKACASRTRMPGSASEQQFRFRQSMPLGRI
jgi:hypothetical protein